MTVQEIEGRRDALREQHRDSAARAVSVRAREAGTARLWASIARQEWRQMHAYQRLLVRAVTVSEQHTP